jgi:excisionase family DNA binding protein
MAKAEITDRRIPGERHSKETPPLPLPLIVSMKEAGHFLSCGHDQIYDLIRAGELESFMEGRHRKITMRSIQALIAKRLAATGGEYRPSKPMPPSPKLKRKVAA